MTDATPTTPIQLADAPAADFLRGPVYNLAPAPIAELRPPTSLHTEPAATTCPAPVSANGVLPMAIHAPAPGQHVDINVTANQPLSFDFNPLDATATRHGDDLTLTFADGGVVVLHHITLHGNPLPTPLQLPDGTVINPCDLLQALPGLQVNPEANKIPNEKIPLENINPAAGPTPILLGAHPVVTPFEIGGFGAGLTPLGPLPPEGFFTTVAFPPPGNGFFPPGPPGPPPFTPPHLLGFQDTPGPLVWPESQISGNFITDEFSASNGVSITAFYSAAEDPGYLTGVLANPGVLDNSTPLLGNYGFLTMDAAGDYHYTLSNTNASGLNVTGTNGVASQLSSDLMSNVLTHPTFNPSNSVVLSDNFFIQGNDNGSGFGSPSDPASLEFKTYGADVAQVVGSLGVAAVAPAPAELLVTFTDAVDPAHSFQSLATVNSAGVLSFSLGTDDAHNSPFQPTDPGLITVENLGSSSVTIDSLNLTGVNDNSVNFASSGGSITVGPGIDHAVTAMIDPDLSTSGDPGDTGSASDAQASQQSATVLTATGTYVDPLTSVPYSFGYLYDTSGTTASANASVDVINLQSAVVGGSEIGGAGTDVLVYNDAAGNTTSYDGGLGLNTLQLQAGIGTLDLNGGTIENATTSTGPGTENQIAAANGNLYSNIEVIDLTAAAAGGSTANTLTLNPSDVFALTQNEPGIVSGVGASNNMWVLGTANDTVELSGNWTAISGSVTASGQTSPLAIAGSGATIPVAANTTNGTQMVGFTEYASVDPTSGNTVHLYVANAIAQAGHVVHA